MAQNALKLLCVLANLGGLVCACPIGCSCRGTSVNCLGLSEFPDALPTQTSEFIMYNTKLSEIPPLSFRDVPNLQRLQIYKSSIDSIRACAFEGLRNLKTLSIYSSRIGSIDSHAFSNIRNVSQLSIYSSSISEINSYVFYNISEIQHISLYNLNITEVKSLAFYEIHQAATFDFYSNNVAIIRSGLFAASSIKDVNIHSSSIEKLECGTIDVIKTAVASNSFSLYQVKLKCDCNIAWMLQPETKMLLLEMMKKITCSDLRQPRNTKLSDLTVVDLVCANNRESSNGSYCAIPEGRNSSLKCGEPNESTSANPDTGDESRVTVSTSGDTGPTHSTAYWLKQDHLSVVCLVFCSFAAYETFLKMF